MPEINETIRNKFEAYPSPVGDICREILAFAQNKPEPAVKEHLDTLIRKAAKREKTS